MKVDLPSLTRFLKAAHPLKKVSVRFVDKTVGGHDGRCECQEDGSFRIQIRKGMPAQSQADTLLHEFAHVRAGINLKDPHNERFGIAYAEVYKLFLEWAKEYEAKHGV